MFKKLSKKEQETWDILSTPTPVPKSTWDEIQEEAIERMAKAITAEIDAEIIKAVIAEANKNK